jgi:tetratricopeptide (TPR) repeat protein
VVADLTEAVNSAPGSPSAEIQLHLPQFWSRPDVPTVRQTHASAATGAAVALEATQHCSLHAASRKVIAWGQPRCRNIRTIFLPAGFLTALAVLTVSTNIAACKISIVSKRFDFWGVSTVKVRLAVIVLAAISGIVPVFAQVSSWEAENAAGMQAYEQAHYAEAEGRFQDAFRQAREFGDLDARLGVALFNLATTFAIEGKNSQAKPLYEQALAIDEQVLGPTHPSVVKILSGLGTLCENESKYPEAESFYVRALEISRDARDPDYASEAIRIYHLSMLYAREGRHSESNALLQRVMLIKDKLRESENPDEVFAFSVVGLAYASQGNFKEALKFYKRTLVELEKLSGPDHPFVAMVLMNLSRLQEAQSKYAEAGLLQERALSIREKIFGPENTEVAASLSELAAVRYLQHNYVETERLYRRASAIWETQPEFFASLDFARIWQNLGVVYVSDKRYDEATAAFTRALSIKEVSLGRENADVGRTLGMLATAEALAGHSGEAETTFQRSLAILEASSPKDYQTLIRVLDSYAFLLIRTGRRAQAEPIQTRAMVYRADLRETQERK